MKGYKVLRIGSRGGLISCVAQGKAAVRYRKDRYNTAPPWLAQIGNHLTIFTNLRLAKDFRSSVCQIWSVHAVGVFEPYKDQTIPLNDLKRGWKPSKNNSWGGFKKWPKGTKMAKKVRLVKRVG